MSQKSALDRIAEAKAKEDYEFERPIRDALGAAIAVQSMLNNAVQRKADPKSLESPWPLD